MRAARLALFGILFAATVLALAAAVRATGNDSPGMDAGMDPQTVLLVDIRSDFTVMEAGTTLPMRAVVVDQHGIPVPGAWVSLAVSGATATPAAGPTDADGVFRFLLTADDVAVATESVVGAVVTYPRAADGADLFRVTVAPVGTQVQVLPPREAVSVGLGAVVAAAVWGTEIGRYGAFKALVFPLYSRLKKEEVLDHFVRGQIYGYIVSHPGQHYNLLRQDLRVTNGTLSHHLRTLEMMGFIKSARDGVFKRFYPVEVSIPQARGVKLSDLQSSILDLVRGSGGPTQAEIAARLDVTQQTVSYNLRTLSREGAIRLEKDGRNIRYYPPAA